MSSLIFDDNYLPTLFEVFRQILDIYETLTGAILISKLERGKVPTQVLFKFDEVYSLSIVTHGYGNDDQPFEVVLIKGDSLCYPPCTCDTLSHFSCGDVEGHLTAVNVLALIFDYEYQLETTGIIVPKYTIDL